MSDWIGDLKNAKVVLKSNKLIVIAKKSKTETLYWKFWKKYYVPFPENMLDSNYILP